jgi:hypothetical protein
MDALETTVDALIALDPDGLNDKRVAIINAVVTGFDALLRERDPNYQTARAIMK